MLYITIKTFQKLPLNFLDPKPNSHSSTIPRMTPKTRISHFLLECLAVCDRAEVKFFKSWAIGVETKATLGQIPVAGGLDTRAVPCQGPLLGF